MKDYQLLLNKLNFFLGTITTIFGVILLAFPDLDLTIIRFILVFILLLFIYFMQQFIRLKTNYTSKLFNEYIDNLLAYDPTSSFADVNTRWQTFNIYSERQKVSNFYNVPLYTQIYRSLKGNNYTEIDPFKEKILSKSKYIHLQGSKYWENDQNDLYQDTNNNTIEELDNYILDKVSHSTGNSFLIIAPGGTGKSTIIQYLARTLAKRWKKSLDKTLNIPFLINFRTWSTEDDFETFLINSLKEEPILKELTFDNFTQIIQSGHVILLLDAMDEISKDMTKDEFEKFMKDLNKLCSQFTNVVMTTRPVFFEGRGDIGATLQLVNISEQTRYTGYRGFYLCGIRKLDHERQEKLIYQQINNWRGRKLSNNIVKIIDDHTDLSELASRPQFLYLITKTIGRKLIFSKNQEFDISNINLLDLYRNEYTRMWLSHEAIRRINTIKDIEDLEELFSHIAWKRIIRKVLIDLARKAMLVNLEISRDEARSIIIEELTRTSKDIAELKNHFFIKTDESLYDVVTELITKSTFFEYIGRRSVYKFIHRTIAAYYVAEGYNETQDYPQEYFDLFKSEFPFRNDPNAILQFVDNIAQHYQDLLFEDIVYKSEFIQSFFDFLLKFKDVILRSFPIRPISRTDSETDITNMYWLYHQRFLSRDINLEFLSQPPQLLSSYIPGLFIDVIGCSQDEINLRVDFSKFFLSYPDVVKLQVLYTLILIILSRNRLIDQSGNNIILKLNKVIVVNPPRLKYERMARELKYLNTGIVQIIDNISIENLFNNTVKSDIAGKFFEILLNSYESIKINGLLFVMNFEVDQLALKSHGVNLLTWNLSNYSIEEAIKNLEASQLSQGYIINFGKLFNKVKPQLLVVDGSIFPLSKYIGNRVIAILFVEDSLLEMEANGTLLDLANLIDKIILDNLDSEENKIISIYMISEKDASGFVDRYEAGETNPLKIVTAFKIDSEYYLNYDLYSQQDTIISFLDVLFEIIQDPKHYSILPIDQKNLGFNGIHIPIKFVQLNMYFQSLFDYIWGLFNKYERTLGKPSYDIYISNAKSDPTISLRVGLAVQDYQLDFFVPVIYRAKDPSALTSNSSPQVLPEIRMSYELSYMRLHNSIQQCNMVFIVMTRDSCFSEILLRELQIAVELEKPLAIIYVADPKEESRWSDSIISDIVNEKELPEFIVKKENKLQLDEIYHYILDNNIQLHNSTYFLKKAYSDN